MLNLTSVFAGEGSVPFQFALDLSDLDFYGNHPFRNKAEVSGRVENHAGIVTLKATVSFVFSAPCDRCGVPVEKPAVGHGFILQLLRTLIVIHTESSLFSQLSAFQNTQFLAISQEIAEELMKW